MYCKGLYGSTTHQTYFICYVRFCIRTKTLSLKTGDELTFNPRLIFLKCQNCTASMATLVVRQKAHLVLEKKFQKVHQVEMFRCACAYVSFIVLEQFCASSLAHANRHDARVISMAPKNIEAAVVVRGLPVLLTLSPSADCRTASAQPCTRRSTDVLLETRHVAPYHGRFIGKRTVRYTVDPRHVGLGLVMPDRGRVDACADASFDSDACRKGVTACLSRSCIMWRPPRVGLSKTNDQQRRCVSVNGEFSTNCDYDFLLQRHICWRKGSSRPRVTNLHNIFGTKT